MSFGTGNTGPAFRLWPPVSVFVPLLVGLFISHAAGDPLPGSGATTLAGQVLVVAFVLWNGWALLVMGRRHTALLPGGETTTVIDTGPFGRSRNPLYVGLLALSAGLALLAASAWALVALPVEWLLLWWGAVRPEERYLAEKFGPEYAAYTARVRRWL